MSEVKFINLTPDPRILRMLGQIELKGWQCVAEFIDNSIDAILKDREEEIENEIIVEIPTRGEISRNEPLLVKDNGVGMNIEELENALKAGYTSQNIDNLGLFGMGFNIASARLGEVVEVWTSKEDMEYDIGVKIDLLEMQRTRSFDRELLNRSKTFNKSGTSIEVSGFHPRATQLLNRSNIPQQLNRIYSKALLDDYNITIKVSGVELEPYNFCVWDDSRSVHYKGEEIPAIISLYKDFGKRNFCQQCLIWLDKTDPKLENEQPCPNCNSTDSIKSKSTQLKGWIGIQRYNHTEEYGFNVIRNGRIIKQFDKSLFTWEDRYDRNDDKSLFEYPIDTTAQGGRIVGEIIADYITPTYTKDSFEETDKLWLDTVEEVRGKSPLQPDIAKSMGFGKNKSPLARLFYGYRKSHPPGRRWLTPGNKEGKGMYEAAREWGNLFHKGDPAYQDDSIWWDHVMLAEVREGDDPGGDPTKPKPKPKSGDRKEDEDDGELYPGKKLLLFNKLYDLESLLGEKPISLTVMRYWPEEEIPTPLIFDGKTSTNFDVYVNQKHQLFRDFADGFEDLVFMELATKFYEKVFKVDEFPVSRIYYELKKKYAADTMLNVDYLVQNAKAIVKDIQNYLSNEVDEVPLEIPPSLTGDQVKLLQHNYLQSENKPLQKVNEFTKTPGFVKFMDLKYVILFMKNYPELLFDNKFFSLPLNSIEATALREYQLDQYIGYFNDVQWFIYELAEFSDELIHKQKNIIIRNRFSLELLNGNRS